MRATSRRPGTPRTPAALLPRTVAACVVLLASLVVVPAQAAATRVDVPQSSLDGSVLFTFLEVDAGAKATVDVNGKTYQHTVTADSFSILVEKLPDGFRKWYANVTYANGSFAYQAQGYVAVDTSVVALTAQMDALQKQLASLQNKSLQQAGSDKGLAQNLSKVQQSISQLRNATKAATAAQSGNQSVAAAYQPATGAGTVELDLQSRNVLIVIGIVLGAILLMALNIMIVMQVRRRAKETMVFMLALAGHEGVTAESPEFKQALDAISGKKPKAPKAPKKAKA